MKNLEIAENSSTLYNLGDDGNNDIWFNVNKHKAGREAEIEAAREIMKRHNMHDKLVEALSDMVEQFANYNDHTGEMEPCNFLCVHESIALLIQAKGEQP